MNLRNFDEYKIGFWSSLFSVLILAPFLSYTGTPVIWWAFFKALIISGTINVTATILLLKAYKMTDISLASPLSSLTPIFLIFVSPVLLGEYLNIYGYVWILFSVIWSYILHMTESEKGFFKPFQLLFTNRGSQYMIFVAFLWSISNIYDKIWAQNSSSLWWLIAIKGANMGVFFLFLIFQKKEFEIRKKVFPLFLLSFIGTIGLFFQMEALLLMPVLYVVSIKRLSSVFSVLWGMIFLKEKHIKYRLLGSLIMFIWVLFLIL